MTGSSLSRISDYLAARRAADPDLELGHTIDTINGTPLYAADLWDLAETAAREHCDLWDLDLPMRPYNALRRGHIRTIEQLTGRSRADLLDIQAMGTRSVGEIEAALHKRGLTLKEDG